MCIIMTRPLVLIVRDGWGKNPYPEWNHANAVHLAKHPVQDRLLAEYPNVLIATSGFDVGLPEGTMGNSEVGHQNIGAGQSRRSGIGRDHQGDPQRHVFREPRADRIGRKRP